MNRKKTILTVLWVLTGVIAVAAIISLLILPKWKGIFLAGCGGFLILNLLMSMFFIRKNFRQ